MHRITTADISTRLTLDEDENSVTTPGLLQVGGLALQLGEARCERSDLAFLRMQTVGDAAPCSQQLVVDLVRHP